MKAFKFRGADQIPYALDIILNNRLFCASPPTLNDPLEGAFYSLLISFDKGKRIDDQIEHSRQASARVIQERSGLRICSLSLAEDDIPLWAYYASGFAGLAIEVELPDNALEIKPIRYTEHQGLGTMPYDDPKQAARESLWMKHIDWKHEKEVRILIDSADGASYYYDLKTPVRRVIVGQRIEPALLDTLKIICTNQNIGLAMAILAQPGSLRIIDIPRGAPTGVTNP